MVDKLKFKHLQEYIIDVKEKKDKITILWKEYKSQINPYRAILSIKDNNKYTLPVCKWEEKKIENWTLDELYENLTRSDLYSNHVLQNSIKRERKQQKDAERAEILRKTIKVGDFVRTTSKTPSGRNIIKVYEKSDYGISGFYYNSWGRTGEYVTKSYNYIAEITDYDEKEAQQRVEKFLDKRGQNSMPENNSLILKTIIDHKNYEIKCEVIE